MLSHKLEQHIAAALSAAKAIGKEVSQARQIRLVDPIDGVSNNNIHLAVVVSHKGINQKDHTPLHKIQENAHNAVTRSNVDRPVELTFLSVSTLRKASNHSIVPRIKKGQKLWP